MADGYFLRLAKNTLDGNYLLHAEPTKFANVNSRTYSFSLSIEEARALYNAFHREFATPVTTVPARQSWGTVTVSPNVVTVADPDKVSLSRKATRARINLVLDELIDLKRSLA